MVGVKIKVGIEMRGEYTQRGIYLVGNYCVVCPVDINCGYQHSAFAWTNDDNNKIVCMDDTMGAVKVSLYIVGCGMCLISL